VYCDVLGLYCLELVLSKQLAEVPGIARVIIFRNPILILPGYPLVPSKSFSQFGPAVWPAIADIHTNI